MKNAIGLLVFVLMGVGISQAQTYQQVKVMLSNGLTVKGSNAFILGDSLSVKTGGVQRIYQMSDVLTIQAREGKATKWAVSCGACCLGACLVSGIASGVEGIEESGSTVPQYIAGSLLWTGISAGIGALIGIVIDDYDVVYVRNTSFLDKVKLDFSTRPFTLQNPTVNTLAISYRF